MPVPYVKKLAKKHGVSISVAEKRWNAAKKQAAKQGHEDEYDYITGIFKKMMKEDFNSLTFKDFLLENTYKKPDEFSPAIVYVSQPYTQWTKHVYDEQIAHIAIAHNGKRHEHNEGESVFHFPNTSDAELFADTLRKFFAKYVDKDGKQLTTINVVPADY